MSSIILHDEDQSTASGANCSGLGVVGVSGPAISRKKKRGGILNPYQAIFLRLRVRTLPQSGPLFRFSEYANGRDGSRTFMVINGGGVIIINERTRAEQAILIGFMQVIPGTDEFAPLRYVIEA